ncbi:uncharacterized protein LOC131953168 [Physella acuta]|uniref:uncharacterized protein LOC131953168 n=1 Tax=Physella acuta TaxID=109671 RepID=UPI0027DCA6AC|nr:uncharacterized protein LOC131953168 [Physella acuta]
MAPSKVSSKNRAARSKLRRKRQSAKATEARQRRREESMTTTVAQSPSHSDSPLLTQESTVLPSVSPSISASKRKLSFFDESEQSLNSDLPSTYVCLETLQSLFTNLQCAICQTQCLQLQQDTSKNCGLAVYLQVYCRTCEEIRSETITSPKSEKVHSVNRQAVAASLATGMGYGGLMKFSELMNTPVLHPKTYNQHTRVIHKMALSYSDKLMSDSANIIRAAYPEQSGKDYFDIDVSYDGTWQTRGHKSKYGVGCVIENRTGLVVDYEVVSKYCHTCSTTGARLRAENQAKFDAWYLSHKASCDINHYGSSGSMEQHAAVKMWARSVEKHQFRYRSVVSDGDTNTIKALHDLSPYKDLTVEKRECLNHVAKRLGTALRNVVETKRKQKITLGGNGKGKLTQSKIAKLQKYYTKALRSCSSIPEMRKAIWATLLHCTSTDEEPKHQDCPQGVSSWCFFQRAVAKGLPTDKHDLMLSSYICPMVEENIRPVYEKMSQEDLLSRCLDGKTQNTNESIHSVIWSRCPKHLFVGRQRLEIAVCLGVGEFNMGSKASHNFLKHINLQVGNKTKEIGAKRDIVRVGKAQRSLYNNESARRKIRRVAEERENKRIEFEEGGPQYIPGGADI